MKRMNKNKKRKTERVQNEGDNDGRKEVELMWKDEEKDGDQEHIKMEGQERGLEMEK